VGGDLSLAADAVDPAVIAVNGTLTIHAGAGPVDTLVLEHLLTVGTLAIVGVDGLESVDVSNLVRAGAIVITDNGTGAGNALTIDTGDLIAVQELTLADNVNLTQAAAEAFAQTLVVLDVLTVDEEP
jgi:hypothetical protein